ncbi:5'/3'-nucleotidase SurE [Streptomyces sp. AC627_RSS907]|uniref:5'/3'-nucleotidase SurE n=1 Tax=Streptomyces sp. AC627_RSS907 TaxID=2823684 RepID=UPI001C24D6C5|nr:5'/3'-nucleotidase SurE [Streptomyces sp. AC627_RSS907]
MNRRGRTAGFVLGLAALGVAGPSVAAATDGESRAATATEARPACTGPLDVLLTNDDGWSAPGIQAVYRALKADGHRVTMVAPLKNQSGMGARIAYDGVLEVSRPVARDDRILAVDGTPADAVAFALHTLPADRYPDVVVSGANYGQNTSRVTNHSGTVGAATTAMDRGVPSIAVSSESPWDYAEDATHSPDFEGTSAFVVKLLRTLQESSEDCRRLLPEGLGLNVNYPFDGLKEARAAKFDTIDPFPTTYTLRKDGDYDISAVNADSDRSDVDHRLLGDGYATITPLDGDLSAARTGRSLSFVSKLVKDMN